MLFLSYCLGHSKWHSISTFCKGVCTRLTFNLFITVILIKSHHDDDSQFRICAHFSLLGVTQWEGFCEWFIIGINFSCRVWIAKKLLHAKQISSGFTVVHWNTCTLYLTKKPFNISYLGFQGNLEIGMFQKKMILPSLYFNSYYQLYYVRVVLILLTDLFILHITIIRVCKL